MNNINLTKTEAKQLDRMNSCYYCGIITKKALRCSTPNCNNLMCKGCNVFINDKPFCIECMIKMLNKDVHTIIFKDTPKTRRIIR